MKIERRDHRVSRHGRRHDFLRRFAPVLVESDFVFAVLSGQDLVEGLLETLAPLGLWPEHFVVVDDSVRIPARLAGITNNLPRDFTIRINPHIKWAQRHSRRQPSLHRVVFGCAEILGDLEGKNPAVAIMPLDKLIGDLQWPAE